MDSLSFKKAADKYSTDEATKANGGLVQNPSDGNTLLDAQMVEPELFFILDTMKVGQISKPAIYKSFDGKEAARIIWLKTKTAPHKANLKDDYAKLQQATISKKQQDAMMSWIKKTTQKNYIVVDDEYKNCEAMKDWIK
jgi:peptidyl-prolyl cis-trans isomerase SurA